jgi:head-tail adaptor
MLDWGRECRVRFERPNIVKDALGTPEADGWTVVATVHGRIKPVRDVVAVQGDQQVRLVTDRFRVRYRPTLARMTLDHQAVCEGRTYEITEIREVTSVDGRPSRREWLEIACIAKPDVGT